MNLDGKRWTDILKATNKISGSFFQKLFENLPYPKFNLSNANPEIRRLNIRRLIWKRLKIQVNANATAAVATTTAVSLARAPRQILSTAMKSTANLASPVWASFPARKIVNLLALVWRSRASLLATPSRAYTIRIERYRACCYATRAQLYSTTRAAPARTRKFQIALAGHP